jgi:hypothetical protein
MGAIEEMGITHVFVHLGSYPPELVEQLGQWGSLELLEEQDGIALYEVGP